MDETITLRERLLYGRLALALPGVDVSVEDGPTGKLHFRYEDVNVAVDRTRVAAAADDIEELSSEVELQLRRRNRAN